MIASFKPAFTNASRPTSAEGRCLNLTVTTVPPLKSTPRLKASVPFGCFHCRKTAELRPASISRMETAMNLRRFASQSILTSLKNCSIFISQRRRFLVTELLRSNTQRFHLPLLAQLPHENRARDIDGGEKINQETDHQGDGETAQRAGAENKQEQ